MKECVTKTCVPLGINLEDLKARSVVDQVRIIARECSIDLLEAQAPVQVLFVSCLVFYLVFSCSSSLFFIRSFPEHQHEGAADTESVPGSMNACETATHFYPCGATDELAVIDAGFGMDMSSVVSTLSDDRQNRDNDDDDAYYVYFLLTDGIYVA